MLSDLPAPRERTGALPPQSESTLIQSNFVFPKNADAGLNVFLNCVRFFLFRQKLLHVEIVKLDVFCSITATKGCKFNGPS